jgi:DNA processing protein
LVPGVPDWPLAVERLGKDAPLWLYVRGDAAVLAQGGVAVIGSRHPTPFGLSCARRFGQQVGGIRWTPSNGAPLAFGDRRSAVFRDRPSEWGIGTG